MTTGSEINFARIFQLQGTGQVLFTLEYCCEQCESYYLEFRYVRENGIHRANILSENADFDSMHYALNMITEEEASYIVAETEKALMSKEGNFQEH